MEIFMSMIQSSHRVWSPASSPDLSESILARWAPALLALSLGPIGLAAPALKAKLNSDKSGNSKDQTWMAWLNHEVRWVIIITSLFLKLKRVHEDMSNTCGASSCNLHSGLFDPSHCLSQTQLMKNIRLQIETFRRFQKVSAQCNETRNDKKIKQKIG